MTTDKQDPTLPPPPHKLQVTLQDSPADVELAQYKRMFQAACEALGAINEALGLDPDDGGAEPILDAIEALRALQVAVPRSDALVREYIEALIVNDPDSAAKATKEMVDYVMLKAAPQPAAYVPLSDEDAIRSAIERHMANFPANCKNAAVEVVHAVLAHKGEVK